jgi:hypothetical protein
MSKQSSLFKFFEKLKPFLNPLETVQSNQTEANQMKRRRLEVDCNCTVVSVDDKDQEIEENG